MFLQDKSVVLKPFLSLEQWDEMFYEGTSQFACSLSFTRCCETMKIEEVKFVFSKKATKIDEIFTVHLSLCSKCQINGQVFVNFCCLLRKPELYLEKSGT